METKDSYLLFTLSNCEDNTIYNTVLSLNGKYVTEIINKTWQAQLFGETLNITEESMLEEGLPASPTSMLNVPTKHSLHIAQCRMNLK